MKEWKGLQQVSYRCAYKVITEKVRDLSLKDGIAKVVSGSIKSSSMSFGAMEGHWARLKSIQGQ